MRRTALAVAALFFGVQAHAGAITQTTFFDFAADATAYSFSNGRDLALAPLGAGVTIAAATPDRGESDAYQVTNPTPSAISFNPLFSDSVNPEADAFYNMAPVLVNPGRGQRPEFTPRPVLSSGYPLSSSRTMNLSPFVGTGLSFASELTLSKDNVDLIKVASRLRCSYAFI